MQSRLLLNLILLLAAIGLALTVWYVYQDKNREHYLSALDISQVNTITIPRTQGDIILSRRHDSWRMEKPYALPAHDFRVQTLLGLLQTPVTQAYSSNELDLTQFGLQPARAIIRFNDVEIQFGKSNPVNNKRYIQSANQIYLLDDTLYPLISAEASSFVNLSLLDSSASIVKLELPGLTLQQDSAQLWHDKNGKTVAADNAQQLLDNWRDTSAFGVHAYMARAHAKPVYLQLADNSTLHFMVLQENNGLIIGRPDMGVEYHFDALYADKLLKLPTTAEPPAAK